MASRIEVGIFVDPTAQEATPMTGVNAGNVECHYTIEARAYGRYMSEVEWLGGRATLRYSLQTDTTTSSSEQVRRR